MLEIIATCIDDAIKIEKNGGDRIELVSSLTEGGLTPSYGLIDEVMKRVSIPVNVMIRPHAKSFIYSDEDIKIMIEDIKIAKKLGANGVVLGILDSEGNIDEENLKTLLKYSDGLEVTFHRAIDESKNLIESVKILKKYPDVKRILTSGGKDNIQKNLDILEKTIENSENNPIILVGGGLTLNNVEHIIEHIKAKEVHFGTAVRKNSSPMGDIDEEKLKLLVKKVEKFSID